jgi:aldose 1-epimerase
MKTILSAAIVCSAALALTATSAMSKTPVTTPFGKLKDGRAVDLITLENKAGASVQITNFGGIVVSFNVPDKAGKMDSIVLGKETLAEYEAGHPFFGAIAGRYANRIAKGKFTLDDKEYTLAVNNPPNSLHGGKEGFDKKLWTVAGTGEKDGAGFVKLAYTSPNGEEGYPGALKCTVTYSFNDKNELKIEYSATTDKATVVNLTNHSYFNLAGHGQGTILDHVAQIYASQYTETDADLIPTGEIKFVENTPLDFRKPVRIGDRIDQKDFLPLKYGAGYDHNFILDGKPKTLRMAATVTDPKSGRTLDCLTTEPAVQLYTANHMVKTEKGRAGRSYAFRGAFCLETQHYPDSPNHPAFPSTMLKPGETYKHTCIYRAGVEK